MPKITINLPKTRYTKMAILIATLLFAVIYSKNTISPTPVVKPVPTYIQEQVVKRIIDGDTIEIENGDKVRLIGINAPEVNGGKNPECGGKDSMEKLKGLIEGKTVTLETDVSNKDKYERYLRYVYLDGIFINLQLVKDGNAKATPYPPDTKFSDELKQAEIFAKSLVKGLWGCKY